MPIELPEDGTSKKVLVVDDEPEMARAIRRVLKNKGINVETAGDGFLAGACLESSPPDLVTLDINMPGLDGYEVLRFIRANHELKNVKVLIVSAGQEESLRRELSGLADDVILKPFENSDLVNKVMKLLE
ncbi:MAG: hypothetical protein COB04_05835 [Gammaproteobacteria bacterium]|nr:MAG: hypothetical protein COB04_05835 [Gammaproteobacteria bacterium]